MLVDFESHPHAAPCSVGLRRVGTREMMGRAAVMMTARILMIGISVMTGFGAKSAAS